MLDLDRLATLCAVIERGSFSAAGEALSLTQPAVSRRISLLEREAGTQLVRRTRQGVRPTEAGRLVAAHAEVALARLTLAEEQLAELAGLRRGRVRMGSFLTALTRLSTEACAILAERHPNVVVEDELVDRRSAFRGLASGDLDLAIVFEHEFEPDPPPEDVELVALFDDPPRVLLPAGHTLARAERVTLDQLGALTWIRAHDGSAARLIDHVLAGAGLHPPLLLAGRGDEPVEAQALVAAGRGVTLAHELNVVLDENRIAARPLAEGHPVRHVQAAIMRGMEAPAPRAVLEALREVGRSRMQTPLHAARRGRIRT